MRESFLKWDNAALAINGLQVLIGYQAFLIERRTSAATHQYLM